LSPGLSIDNKGALLAWGYRWKIEYDGIIFDTDDDSMRSEAK
jgi:hypothetical protein